MPDLASRLVLTGLLILAAPPPASSSTAAAGACSGGGVATAPSGPAGDPGAPNPPEAAAPDTPAAPQPGTPATPQPGTPATPQPDTPVAPQPDGPAAPQAVTPAAPPRAPAADSAAAPAPTAPTAAPPQASTRQEAPPTPSPPRFSGEIKVIGQSPLEGAGQAGARAAATVESATSADIAVMQPLEISDFMASRLASVMAADTQGNPFERDLQIRGFTASPVLGTPQGIALYQDGVRLNEPFGDTIDWDLIPLAAVLRLDLVQGASPMFGLNAEGGVITLDTKTGLTDPGVQANLHGGSFGSRGLDGAAGHRWGGASALVATDLYDEDGWREHSPTKVGQLFGNLGWAGDRGSVDLSVTGSEARLAGNGATPVQLLAEDPRAVFTFPDATSRSSLLTALRFGWSPGATTLLDGNVYGRRILTSTVNGDASSYDPCALAGNSGLLCIGSGDGEQPVRDQFGQNVPVGTPPLNGAVNDTRTRETAFGGSFQAAFSQDLAGRHNELLAGATTDLADARFAAQSELGILSADRDTLGDGLVTLDSLVRVDSRLDRTGLFVADTYLPRDDLTVHLAGRFDVANVHLDDQLGGDLSGRQTFHRFNPSAGLTYALGQNIVVYGRYAESSRPPNPIELTCSDPTAACRLPSAFVSDPPLAQVVTRNFELGARGQLSAGGGGIGGGIGGQPAGLLARAGRVQWSLALYRADSLDDILFINSGTLIGQGFFANVGRTRRQGLDLDLRGAAGEPVSWFLAFSLTDARFETPFLAASPDNPFATNGTIAVARGARLPLIPLYDVKAGFDAGTQRWRAGLEFLYLSPELLRGDEANLAPPLPGQELVTATGRVVLSKRLALVARITNVLDRQLASFGTFGEAGEVLGPGFDNPRFLVPVAPRAYTVGIQLGR
jgi:iron complex outermembrane receptor protein